MSKSNEFHWAKLLRHYAFDSHADTTWGFLACCGIVRQACNGAFDVGDTARCRSEGGNRAIVQKRDLPWRYLYECIRLSGKDFHIFLPKTAPCRSVPFRQETKRQHVYAWYDEESDGVAVLAYTGKWREEQITYPEFDGYGRFDYEDEIVTGIIDKDGKWMSNPQLRWI